MLIPPAIDLPNELLLAFLAGILLNLTPCVLPIIPLKIRTILHHSGASPRHRLEAAITFLIVLMVGFATIIFFNIDMPVPVFPYHIGGGRCMEPLISGFLAAILSTPCTGPFLGGVFAGGLLMPSQSITPLHWQSFTKARLAAAQRAHHPVLVEFTAAWCINCKILEKTIYVNPTIVQAARHQNLAALRVDLTQPNQTFKRLLVKDGGDGLPFAEIRSPSNRITQIFRGLFTSTALIKAVVRSTKNNAGINK